MKTAANGGIWSGISQTAVTHVAARPQRPEDDTYVWVRKEINNIINIICLNNSPKKWNEFNSFCCTESWSTCVKHSRLCKSKKDIMNS